MRAGLRHLQCQERRRKELAEPVAKTRSITTTVVIATSIAKTAVVKELVSTVANAPGAKTEVEKRSQGPPREGGRGEIDR